MTDKNPSRPDSATTSRVTPLTGTLGAGPTLPETGAPAQTGPGAHATVTGAILLMVAAMTLAPLEMRT